MLLPDGALIRYRIVCIRAVSQSMSGFPQLSGLRVAKRPGRGRGSADASDSGKRRPQAGPEPDADGARDHTRVQNGKSPRRRVAAVGSRNCVLLWEQLLNPSEALQRLWKELE
jgi:hypothetical protein